MRLPRTSIGQVQSMGRHNLGAVGAVASATSALGTAENRVIQSMATLAKDYIEREENAQHNKALADTHIEVAQYMEEFGVRQEYTADEVDHLPDAAVRKWEGGSDEQGNMFKRKRTNIPAHEVWPQLLRHKMQSIIKKNSSNIQNPLLREQYENRTNQFAGNKILDATIKSSQQQIVYQQKVAKNTAFDLSVSDVRGARELARFEIENGGFDELTEKLLIEEINKRHEWANDTRILTTLDPTAIGARLAELRQPTYGKGEEQFFGVDKNSGPLNQEAAIRRFQTALTSVHGKKSNENKLRYKELIRAGGNGNLDTNPLYENNKYVEIIQGDPSLSQNDKNILTRDAITAYYRGNALQQTRTSPLEADRLAIAQAEKALQTVPADYFDEAQAALEAQKDAFELKQKQLEKDATGYLIKHDPAVGHLAGQLQNEEVINNPVKYQATMRAFLHTSRASQERMGLTPQEVNFLTPLQVSSFKESSDKVGRDPTGVTNLITQMDMMREQYSDEWPAIYGQLVREGALKPEHVMGDIIKDPSLLQSYIYSVESKEEREKTPFYKQNIKNTRTSVANALLPLRETLLTQGAHPNALAGMSVNEQLLMLEEGIVQMVMAEGNRNNLYQPHLVKKIADKVINDNWIIHDTTRIPKGKDYNPESVVSGLSFLRNYNAFEIAPEVIFHGMPMQDISPEDNQKILRDQFMNHATPSTNSDESGVVFKYASGDPVLIQSNGRIVPLTVSFEELAAFGENRRRSMNYRMVIK